MSIEFLNIIFDNKVHKLYKTAYPQKLRSYMSSVSLLEAIKSTQWTRPCCEELQLFELTIVVLTHLVPISISNKSVAVEV